MPGDRTEQATSHRRQKARQDGDVLHSRELTAASGTLAGVLALGFVGMRAVESWHDGFSAFLLLGANSCWEHSTVTSTLFKLRSEILSELMAPALVMGSVAVAAFLAAMAQVGGVSIHANVLGLRLERINPAANLRNLYSLRAASRLGKSLLPAGVLAVFAVQRVAQQMRMPPFSLTRLERLGTDVYGMLSAAAWVLFIWSGVDYLIEWQSRESRLKMSRQEMREEFKETEGSPQIRSRIRGLQRQMRRRRVKEDVSKAAVVITNPTHYAVALSFDFATMDAPKVLAKGRNLLAEEIKAEARWAGVPIVENPPLARGLYRTVEIGHAIPVDLYAAVAAILAYLYRQRVEAEMRERRARETAATRPANAPKQGDRK